MKRAWIGDTFTAKRMASKKEESRLSGDKKRIRFRSVIIAACILLVILLFGNTLHAVGINVWRLIVSWDDETMEMRMDTQGRITGRGYRNDLDPTLDDAFFLKLDELEIKPLLPSWIPNGFVLERVESKIETEYLRWALGAYTFGELEFHISVTKNTSESPGGIWNLEKDERMPEEYEQGGIKFYIMDNLSRSRAFWFDPPYTVNISGHLSRDELKQMIDSMFERR